MLKRFFSLSLVLLCSIVTLWADEVSNQPILDVCFRTNSGNTGWQYVNDAAEEGKTVFESNYNAGIFTM